jgi:hypothetical protein
MLGLSVEAAMAIQRNSLIKGNVIMTGPRHHTLQSFVACKFIIMNATLEDNLVRAIVPKSAGKIFKVELLLGPLGEREWIGPGFLRTGIS